MIKVRFSKNNQHLVPITSNFIPETTHEVHDQSKHLPLKIYRGTNVKNKKNNKIGRSTHASIICFALLKIQNVL